MSHPPDPAPETEPECGAPDARPQGARARQTAEPPGFRPGVSLAHGLIRAYQVTLSGLIGRHCRHLPSCSEYTDEAIRRHGVWAGGWMGFARICRCQPWGTQGLDFVPVRLPAAGAWYRPWRYGLWRSTCVDPFRCEAVSPMPGQDAPGQDFPGRA